VAGALLQTSLGGRANSTSPGADSGQEGTEIDRIIGNNSVEGDWEEQEWRSIGGRG